jgi:hypothetical protein
MAYASVRVLDRKDGWYVQVATTKGGPYATYLTTGSKARAREVAAALRKGQPVPKRRGFFHYLRVTHRERKAREAKRRARR